MRFLFYWAVFVWKVVDDDDRTQVHYDEAAELNEGIKSCNKQQSFKNYSSYLRQCQMHSQFIWLRFVKQLQNNLENTYNNDEDKKEKGIERIRVHDVKHDVCPSCLCRNLQ